VLLVDDDKDVFTLVRKYLNEARSGPFQVEWASSFEAALSTLEAAEQDVCLLDYRLGERTGMELLTEVRASGIELPIIVLTGVGSFELDMEAMEMGAFDYLEKAELTPALLERSIRYTIENHRARAALRKANEELEQRVRERTAELDRSNRDLEQFANVVASDLQIPLQTITREIEKMKVQEAGYEGERTPALASRYLEPVLHAVRNMELMVKSVLDCSQARTDAEPFEMVDLSDIVKEACAELNSTITEAQATVEVESLPSVRGDPRCLVGLFENLLSNAIAFRGTDPPKVCIRAERKGDSWLCAVSDNGIGVKDEDADDIFLMFNRGTVKTDYPGIGIGLAMCRKVIQAHGGTIWVDSKEEGGSTFYFTLPAE
jgi:light-regulated signal transduction histidine kinase (bacteriophytochrome)